MRMRNAEEKDYFLPHIAFALHSVGLNCPCLCTNERASLHMERAYQYLECEKIVFSAPKVGKILGSAPLTCIGIVLQSIQVFTIEKKEIGYER